MFYLFVQSMGELGWADDKIGELLDDCLTSVFNGVNVTEDNATLAIEQVCAIFRKIGFTSVFNKSNLH